ncbi:hypothetical protein [Lentzea aerocolonigenes]|uniref:hypothetical protein n=1 Tax=Lentzea aerocolonigenes TaxID=68170 RepID=UPI0012E2BD3B|nr:hypothetical protein [Lentzea aerocolonigenes]
MACEGLMTAALKSRLHTHHGSHRSLLHTAPRTSVMAPVDAIIVPTVRRPRALTHAVDLAAELNCTLVTLHSGCYSSARTTAELAAARGAELLAVDVGEAPLHLLPRFRTSALLEGTRFGRHNDISLKRNLGLLIARTAGWQRIVFLDDDIVVPDPLDLRRAAALTDWYAGVGLNIQGYPDNSVVCHAFREAGGAQDVFVSGGALAVNARSTSLFFPNIYNEDWFFLLDADHLGHTAVTGIAIQQPYDPFAQDIRARMEELGDVLAEGLYWLLDEGYPLQDADTDYWRAYLRIRQRFILDTMEMVRAERPSELRARKLDSLKAAWGRSQYIKPEWCEAYVQAWRDDRRTWQQHLERIQPSRKANPRAGNVEKVVANLGLAFCSRYLPGQSLGQDVADLDLSMPVAVTD